MTGGVSSRCKITKVNDNSMVCFQKGTVNDVTNIRRIKPLHEQQKFTKLLAGKESGSKMGSKRGKTTAAACAVVQWKPAAAGQLFQFR